MIALTYKSTHYATIALKLLIVGCTGWYLYHTLVHLTALSWNQFWNSWNYLSIGTVLFVGLASLLNWGLEAKKWQLLARSVQPIGFSKAFAQTMTAFALSVTTPNRLGEYPAKAWFFPKEHWKRVMILNLAGNSAQMLVTVSFGLIGLLVWSEWLPIKDLPGWFLGTILVVLLVGIGLLVAKRTSWLSRIKTVVRNKWWKQVLLLAVLRYACFGSAFFLLLMPHTESIAMFQMVGLLGCYYLFSSVLPTWMVLDVVVKGSVAIWLFAWAGIDPLNVMAAVLIMWLLNYLLPALIGSGLFLRHKHRGL